MEKLHHLIKAELLTPSIVTELFKEAESFNQSLRAGVRHFENLKGMTLCSLFVKKAQGPVFLLRGLYFSREQISSITQILDSYAPSVATITAFMV